MASESQIPQQLMTAALLVFEKGVPIDDCNLQNRVLRDRLARVQHVYWQWVKNPLIDIFELFRNLLRGQCSDRHSLWRMAKRDEMLFEFVRDHVVIGNRRQDEAVVRAAANQAIRIGMETDNVNALTKGGKLLYEVAGLDKPEDQQADMSKVAFLPSVVVTNIEQIDPDKTYVDDEETRRIAAKYGAYIPDQRKMVEDQVALMEARADAKQIEKEDGDE